MKHPRWQASRAAGLLIAAALAAALAAPQARGSSGPAHSGLFASADSALTATANPAGLTRIERPDWVVQVLGFSSESTFVTTEDSFSGVTVDDNTGGIVIPLAYHARPINDRLGFGLSFSVTGGVGEDLDDTGPQRYLLDDWSLGSVSLSPAIGYRVHDRLSIGGALNVTYTVLDYESAVFNPEPGFDDGRMEVDAGAVSLGFQLAALFEASERTRFGLSYRSEIDPDLSDTPEFSGLSPAREALLEQGGVLTREIGLEANLPQSVGFGAFHELTGSTVLTFDAVWLDFSEFGFSELALGDASLTVREQDFDDILAFTAGVNAPFRERWRLKGGVLYLTEAIDDANRTMALRLDALWGAGFGVEYRWRENRLLAWNLNYYELGDAPVDTDVPLQGRLVGEFTRRRAVGIDFTLRWYHRGDP